MSPHYSPTGPSVATRELLFVGFESDFDACIHNFPYQSEEYNYEIVNSPILAFQWLEERVGNLETYQLPYGVLFNLQWLLADDFRLVHQILAHADLRYIPIIALAEKSDVIDKALIVCNNVDDCYTVPIQWEMLESRLDFLNQYKPQLVQQTPRVTEEQFGFQIPLGKRVFDVAAACIGILLASPLLMAVVIAIRLESKGPVLYRSKRVGAGYRVFDFLKFRSMFIDADGMLQKMQHLNQYTTQENGPVFIKIANDPRITRVGRVIRKYSIDELPQLFNVLTGDMSLVGNRPLPLYEAEALTRDEWSARFLAPAGITGLWQVTKRGQSDMSAEERIALDIAYSQDYSVTKDLEIILKTFRAFIQKENV